MPNSLLGTALDCSLPSYFTQRVHKGVCQALALCLQPALELGCSCHPLTLMLLLLVCLCVPSKLSELKNLL